MSNDTLTAKTPRKSKLKDPYAEREAGKYARPIPSRELILEVLIEQGAPLAGEEIAELLVVNEAEDLESLRRRLNAMEGWAAAQESP